MAKLILGDGEEWSPAWGLVGRALGTLVWTRDVLSLCLDGGYMRPREKLVNL